MLPCKSFRKKTPAKKVLDIDFLSSPNRSGSAVKKHLTKSGSQILDTKFLQTVSVLRPRKVVLQSWRAERLLCNPSSFASEVPLCTKIFLSRVSMTHQPQDS